MNRILTQLNTTKIPIFKSWISTKFYFINLFGFALILNIHTQAQSNNCPTGDPLEWEWVQEIINYAYGCDVAEIRVLDFDEDDFIVTIGGEPENVPCVSSTKNRIYDCQGNGLAEFDGDISTFLDPVLFPEPYEYYSIWTYVDRTNQSIIPVEGCRGDLFEFEIGLPTDPGESCEPAGQRIDIVPNSYANKPSIKNLTKNDCTISFSLNGSGDFIYSIDNPDSNLETFNYVFLLIEKENCETPASQPVIPKDWRPFPANQKTWFEFSNENFKLPALYYATNASQEDDQILYYLDGNNTMGVIGNYYNEDCLEEYTSRTQDFISVTEPFVEQNGLHYYEDQLVFDANLMVGESIIIQSENYLDFDEVHIECVEQSNENVFGQSDEVKVFSLQAHANGQPVESAFDNFNYILSRSFGFLQFLPFTELLNVPKTTATITGFEDEQSNLIGTKGEQFKPPYEAGDVIYYSERTGNFPSIFNMRRMWRDSITMVEHYKDSLIYTFDRLEIVEEIMEDSLHPENDTLINIDTIQSYNSLETFIFDEQLDKNNDFGYNPQGYGVYNSIYGYALRNYGSPEVYLYNKLSIQPSCFSFKNESATIVQSHKPIQNINEGCVWGGTLDFGLTDYHSELGLVSIRYNDDCCVDLRWSLDVYKKGNQLYSPFMQLNPVYDISDSSVILWNECYKGASFDVTGPAIENGIFYPVFVPDSLLNQPIEISFKSSLYETKQTIRVSNSIGEAFEIDPFFDDKKWLSDHLNLRECLGETVQVFEDRIFTYFYLTRNSGEGILFSSYNGRNPRISCEDNTEDSTCLAERGLSNPVSTWVCETFISATEEQLNQTINLFNIRPNPTTGKVFIDLPNEAVYQISLINISGKVVKQLKTKIDESMIEMNVSDLPKGIYLAELKNESNQMLQKLIIE